MPMCTRPSITWSQCRLTLDEKYAICRSVGEEVIQEDELRNLLDKKKSGLVAYDGFEPSGRMHIAQVGGTVNQDQPGMQASTAKSSHCTLPPAVLCILSLC